MGTRKNLGVAFNIEVMLKNYLSLPVAGGNGILIVLREIINNSIDARAKRVRIWFDTYNGKKALFVADDGIGLNESAIKAFMSHGFSNKLRDDIKTIGVNGTGSKHAIGLGERFDKNHITLLSVSKELPRCTEMNVDYDYLVELLEKQDKMPLDNHVKETAIPSNWNKYLKERTTGATFIYTGFTKKEVGDAAFYINQLGNYISPKSAEFVRIMDDNGQWQPIKEAEMQGTRFKWDISMDTLGKVELDFYYGGSKSNLMICGPVNSIMPLSILLSRMTPDQKGSIKKIFYGLSGFIYLEKGNTFRTHEGNFNDNFYRGDACTEFLMVINDVSKELEKMVQQEKERTLIRERTDLIDRIVTVARTINPLNTGSGLKMGHDGKTKPLNGSTNQSQGGNSSTDNFTIKGQRFVKPGDMASYEIYPVPSDNQKISWRLIDPVNGIKTHTYPTSKNVTIEVSKSILEGTRFILEASCSTIKARKTVEINSNPPKGTRSDASLININGINYHLSIGTHYPDTLAQLDWLMVNDGTPEIVHNPVLERLKNKKNFYAAEEILNAIAVVAMLHQLSIGRVEPSFIPSFIESFVQKMKPQLFETTKDKE